MTVIGAGRTDTGVHATGQVIAFELEWKHGERALLRAVNATLPDDIALQDIRQQEGFHPRFDALSRLYRYRIIQSSQRQPLLRARAWHVWGDLNAEALAQAAQVLLGEHDFASFGQPPQGENTLRTVYRSEWMTEAEAYGTMWTYTIEANAFLQHMVRRIVGLLVRVGQAGMTIAEFEAIFRRGRLAEAISLAPPQGLTLEAVRYNE